MKSFALFMLLTLLIKVNGRISSKFIVEEHHLIIVSDKTTLVKKGSTWVNSVPMDYYKNVDWVSKGYVVWDGSDGASGTILFIKTFNVPGNPISCLIKAWVDDTAKLYLNDVHFGDCTANTFIYQNLEFDFDLSAKIIPGMNTLKIEATSNILPAGVLFYMDIKYN